ncbi:DUF5684 domain-containing protein [Clostridium arbusti]|uniref:DUF5684 domain-containing protein n=1 Tax=Clostridium arbusti TaxID=1137848 RepID=UPI000287B277|nr:DUF5684 domain-containing protein [Clostridium arbusti]
MLGGFFYLMTSKTAIIMELINYIIFSIAWCKLCDKAKIKNQWLSFIPFLQIIIFLHMIDRSGWYGLLLIIPVVNIILMIIWLTEFYNSFNITNIWIAFSIAIYPLGCIYMIYMAYSDKIDYVGCSQYELKAMNII